MCELVRYLLYSPILPIFLDPYSPPSHYSPIPYLPDFFPLNFIYKKQKQKQTLLSSLSAVCTCLGV